MHIEKLSIANFRGAKELKLFLHPRLNVFVGMNGAGKSTILDATAILLSWLANRIKTHGASGKPIKESDIRNDSIWANSAINLNDDDDPPVNWTITKVRSGHSRKDIVAAKLNELSELSEKYRIKMTETDGRTNLPLLAYYPVNRVVLDIPKRIRSKHSFDILSIYEESLTNSANFRTFFEWFREREDFENQQVARKARKDRQLRLKWEEPDRQLDAVRHALHQFMPNFTDLRIERNPLSMKVEKNGQTFSIEQLSGGEKCLMALVGDIAQRLAVANPLRGKPLEGEGIVLIDEIDLHLHPAWQRLVIPKLTEVFPNCQFLISTHSPNVITHAKPQNLHLLSMEKGVVRVTNAGESYGQTVERILEDLMELETTRPDAVAKAVKEIYALIDKGKLEDAKKAIEKLQEEIGSDPELTRASVLIKRKKAIGK